MATVAAMSSRGIAGLPASVAVTGASGFVGHTLCRVLLSRAVSVRALVRSESTPLPVGVERYVVGNLASMSLSDWSAALQDTECVFHLAAIAHAPDAADIARVNVAATATLAEAAFTAGLRLVHVSTVKVHGDNFAATLTEAAPFAPGDAYGRSKLKAEQEIAKLALARSGQWIAIRPPIVFGDDDRGNFARMVRLATAGWPLPLAAVQNRRSMVHVDVLADALCAAAALPRLPGRALLLSGGQAWSTPQWLRCIADAAGRPLRLWHCPEAWLRGAATVAGAGGVADRLLGSLAVDDTAWRTLATWQPPITTEVAVATSVRALLKGRRYAVPEPS